MGLHAPKELKEAIGMGPNDQCSLLGGAYGRADAPILWYRTLRKTLEGLEAASDSAIAVLFGFGSGVSRQGGKRRLHRTLAAGNSFAGDS